MAGTGARIDGLAQVKRAFALLEPRVARKVIRKAERAAAKLFQAEIAAHVPVDSGKLKGTLKVRSSKGPRGAKKSIAIAVLVGQAGGREAAGLKTAWYAYLQEKGYHIGRRVRQGKKVTGYVPSGNRNAVHFVPGKHFTRDALRAKESDARQLLVAQIAAGVDREAAALAAKGSA